MSQAFQRRRLGYLALAEISLRLRIQELFIQELFALCMVCVFVLLSPLPKEKVLNRPLNMPPEECFSSTGEGIVPNVVYESGGAKSSGLR